MEKRIKDWIYYPTNIIEQREEYVLFDVKINNQKWVVNSNTLSGFSKRHSDNDVSQYEINCLFDQCKKLSEFEEIIKYNFDIQWLPDDDIRVELVINLKYIIYSFMEELYIEDYYSNDVICT